MYLPSNTLLTTATLKNNIMNFLKTKLLLTLTLLSISLLTVSCNEEVKKDAEESQSEIKAPEQIISVEQAKTMYDTYTLRRVKLIDSSEQPKPDGSKFEAARYTSYDYKTIKTYLAYIEQEAALAGKDISTLRFYFSNYPDKAKFEDGRDVKHPRQNSFFIVPTIEQDGIDHGFFTIDGDNDKREAILIKDYLKIDQEQSSDQMGIVGPQNQKSYASFIPSLNASNAYTSPFLFQGDRSLILNEGNSAPPPNSDF